MPNLSKFWAIRECDSLKSPAVFSDWDDCSFYVDADENEGKVIYKEFDNLADAIAYAFPRIRLGYARTKRGATAVGIRGSAGDALSYRPPEPVDMNGEPKLVSTKTDIFCGRGGFVNANPGNVLFRSTVNKYKKDYNSQTNRSIKTAIAWKIVNEIRNKKPPGRFLQKYDDGRWFDIGDIKAIAKTKQALREMEADKRKSKTPLQPLPVDGNTSDLEDAQTNNERRQKGTFSESDQFVPNGKQVAEDSFENESISDDDDESATEDTENSNQGENKQKKRPLSSPNSSPASKRSRNSTAAGRNFSRCVPLDPAPATFTGNIEKMKRIHAPSFKTLMNFPNRPAGCCSMCGEPRPNKRNGSVDEPVIPKQNKGVCTGCDVKVWVVLESNLQVKWCKGCKNFRTWASFGDKGHTTKCWTCREHQAQRYFKKKAGVEI